MRKAHLQTLNRNLCAPSQASDAAYNLFPAGGQNGIRFSPTWITWNGAGESKPPGSLNL